MNSQNMDTESDRLCFSWDTNPGDDFIQLVQQGFQVKVRVESNIRNVVCDQIGVAQEYLDHRINTIFLDGSPVDDVDSATIHAGSSLALSAAMPGLVGATMRKAGYYAAMRQGITYVADEHRTSDNSTGFFTLKLFNLVATELGPLFLARGIWIARKDLERFLANRPSQFWTHCLKVQINDKKIEPNDLSSGNIPGKAALVFVKCDVTTDSMA